jgi:glycosyltransferase involved in cell wall biosynthesis
MSDGFEDVLIGIVTPTYQRPSLLRRFIHRLQKQSYGNWIAVIIHDGPSEEFRRISNHFSNDSRLRFLATDARANDCGNSPRLKGAEYLTQQLRAPDYALFWDDDDYFYGDSLAKIAKLVTQLNQPDHLLVGMEYRKRILPPQDVPFSELGPGEVCTPNSVVRPALGVKSYRQVVERNSMPPGVNLLISDFLAFDVMRAEQQSAAVRPDAVRPDVVIGFVDGLRWMPFMRHLLGIPPLDLASRPWVQKLTLGKYTQRSTGGLD